jgi:catechol 2,3-dioxygenase-like lactoylglutathione lyase family enzyme
MGFIHAVDLDRARSFYCETLGLEFVETTPFALVIRSGPMLVRITPTPDYSPVEGTVFGWIVEDIDATLRGLISDGVAPARFAGLEQDELGVWQSPATARVAWFTDPDGNLLSITQF